MKNFGSILAFIAVSATFVSGRALPIEKGVEARAPYPVGKIPCPTYNASLMVCQMLLRYTLVSQRRARLLVSVTKEKDTSKLTWNSKWNSLCSGGLVECDRKESQGEPCTPSDLGFKLT